MATLTKVKTVTKKEVKKEVYPTFNGHESARRCIRDAVNLGDDHVVREVLRITVLESKGRSYSVRFYKEEMQFCCGVDVLGSLSADRVGNIDMSKSLSQLLDAVVEEIGSGKTLVMTTNGKDASKHFEKALAICKHWTLVKSFKNKNSGNIVKFWMSNND